MIAFGFFPMSPQQRPKSSLLQARRTQLRQKEVRCIHMVSTPFHELSV